MVYPQFSFNLTKSDTSFVDCLENQLCTLVSDSEKLSDDPISLWFLLGLLIGPYLVLIGVAAWIGDFGSWVTNDSTLGTYGHGGFQFPSILMAMGFMGTLFGQFALLGLWPSLEDHPAFMAVGGALMVAGVWALVFGGLIPFIAFIWWPIHRVWGPR